MDWLGFKELIKDSIGYIILFFVVLIIVLYVVTVTQILGPSMENGLKDKDVLVVLKLYNNIKRSDVVSLEYKDTKNLIKRVIGLPNDQVIIKDGLVYVNDVLLEEPYLKEQSNTKIKYKDFGTIPKDEYLVLGDNRDDSFDSRTFGFVKKEDITGKVLFKMFPFNRIGLIR